MKGKFKMNNILVVTEGISEDYTGGAQTYIHNMTKGLQKKNNNIFIITRKHNKFDENVEKINGNNVYRHSYISKNTFFYKAYPFFSYYNSRKIFNKLNQKHNFDSINFHFPFSAAGIISDKSSNKIKKTYTFHAPTVEELLNDYKNHNILINKSLKLFLPLINKFENYALQNVDEIIVLSKYMKDKLLNIHNNINEDKINIIPGGVDTKIFRPLGNKRFESDQIIFFTARRLVPRMGLENLICAFEQNLKKHKNIKLYIAGGGPLKEKLRDMIQKRNLNDYINLLGYISKEDLLYYYDKSNFFVLPTKELEGFGLVTIESMAMGTPVIATPVGGSKEILGKFNKDLLMESISVNSISKKIDNMIELYKNQEKYRELTIRTRNYVQQNYSWENITEQINNILLS